MLITYVIFAYNHERFIEAALRSAFAQTYEPMEIVIIDDGSSDATAERIERLIADYSGPKKVQFLQNLVNQGGKGVIMKAVTAASGEIVVAADGDDVSVPHRSAAIAATMKADPQLQCLSSNCQIMSEDGAVEGLYYPEPIAERTLRSFENPNMGLLGATAAFRRSLFDVFGPLDDEVLMGDRVIPFRAAIIGKLGYIDEALVLYRRHGNNLWLRDGLAPRDMPSWWNDLKRRNALMVPVLRNRIMDLKTGLELRPDRSEEIRSLHATTAVFLKRYAVEHELYRGTGLLRKFILAAKMKSTGVSWRYLRGWMRKFLFPEWYFRTIHFKENSV